MVDDDDSVRTLFVRVLRDAGHEVAEAADGRAALRMQREQPADLIVLDLVMPEMDGIELLRELRGGQAGAPIIAVTGGNLVAAQPNLAAASLLGATRVLAKPFPTSTLVELAAELLGAEPDEAG